jgi:hypothetical protein
VEAGGLMNLGVSRLWGFYGWRDADVVGGGWTADDEVVGYFDLTSVNRRTEDMGERSTSPQTRIRPNINKARLS